MKGYAIVRAVMAERRLGKEDFFHSKFPEHVKARRIAIKRLHEAGLNKSEIGRAVQRTQCTIRYWLSKEVRERKRQARIKRWHEVEARA
jgi:hypothetical protein